MKKQKQLCQYCGKEYKRVKLHLRSCKRRIEQQRQPEVVNFITMSPHARLIKAANEYWESLYDHQKIHAIAFAIHPGAPQ
jgi:hypothetical protein